MSVPILTIKNNLQIGDQIRIAKELNCSTKMVYLVLNGQRGARQTKLQTDIKELAIKLGSLNAQKNQTLKPQEVEA